MASCRDIRSGVIGNVPSASLQPILTLLGFPLEGNPTQYMIEKAFDHHQLDWRYLSVEVAPDGLGDAVRGMRVMGFSGGNCADPHKQAVIEHLDRLGETAELAGVVNCILRQDRDLVGENTEGKAMLEAIRRRTDPAGKRIVLLGAGRVARAIAVEMAQADVAEMVVVNRTEETGRGLVELIGSKLEVPASLVVWDETWRLPDETDVLVNATSVGSEDAEARLSLDFDSLSRGTLVADMTTDPPRTQLIRQAEDHGCETVDGLEVFVSQAVINFKLWTGIDADTTVMREAVEEFLEV
jgi:shikimate dehydrogenase